MVTKKNAGKHGRTARPVPSDEACDTNGTAASRAELEDAERADKSELGAGSAPSANDSDRELLDCPRLSGGLPSQKPLPAISVSDAPDWTTWKKRPAVSVQDGVRLAHNIRPDARVWESMKSAGDPRASAVGTASKTASLSMDSDARLKPINAAVKERQRDRLGQKVDLRKFASWAVETIDNPFMTPEFRALVETVPAPSSFNDDRPDAWDRSIELLRERYPMERPDAVTRRLQSVARLLVAVAVDKYGLDVTQGSETSNGTIAAFERLTADAGFTQMEGSSIKTALSLAVDLVGRDRVLAALTKRAAKPKR